MFDFEWKFNGKKIRPDQLEKEFMKSAAKNVQKQLKRNIESQRCPTHGRSAKFIAKYRNSLEGMNVETCCEEFKNAMLKKFAK